MNDEPQQLVAAYWTI